MRISRRQFLQLASAASLVPFVRYLPAGVQPAAGEQRPNIIIILFDALTAFNLSIYGYPRRTASNIERFAAGSTVYHNHHSAGNFTTPSTASLFTGTVPWTHRAFNLAGLVRPKQRPLNLFSALGPAYHRLVFTQNIYADMLLYQFEADIDRHPTLDSFTLAARALYPRLAPNDAIYGMKSLDQFLFKREEAHGSLYFSILGDLVSQVQDQAQAAAWKKIYPQGLPRLANTNIRFAFEQLTDGLIELLSGLPAPTFAYLHLMPPHAPYTPSRQFLGSMNDGWAPPERKKHRLAAGVPQNRLNELRQTYDEFIANLDAEFGRLLDHLESSGLLDNSFVILTSDHGEIFERGASGHSTPMLFEPGIRVPLIVSSPGRRRHEDIHALTSNVDLLPTLMHLSGQAVPEWAEGTILPGLGGTIDPQRSIFVVEAKANPANSPLRKASTALIGGRLKLVHYTGYRYYKDAFELYDLEEDPDEVNNRFDDHPDAQALVAELEAARTQADNRIEAV